MARIGSYEAAGEGFPTAPVNPLEEIYYALAVLRDEAEAEQLSVLQAYDETLSLYDSEEQLRAKIQRLEGSRGTEPRQEPLSAREREIVVCIVKGMTNKQIVDHLCISTHTVITHRRNIIAKLQIHSPAGLTIYAIVNKLVELSDVKESIGEL